MICLSLIAIAPLFEFLAFSAGVLGILAIIGNACDGYAGDQASTFLESETEGN